MFISRLRLFGFSKIKASRPSTLMISYDSYYTKDADISDYADRNGFVVVTKDADFQNSHLLKNTPERLLKISLGNLSTKKLLIVLEKHLPSLIQHFSKGKCMIEIGDGFVKITE